MAIPEASLVCGPAPWLRAAHLAVSSAAAAALLSAGLGVFLTAAALLALVTTHLLSSRRMDREAARAPRLRLGAVPGARLLTAEGNEPAEWAPGGLDSAWLLVLPLRSLQTGRLHRCLVTRSRNSPDDFRRARVLLRFRPGDRSPGSAAR